jgi:hypothetical protein
MLQFADTRNLKSENWPAVMIVDITEYPSTKVQLSTRMRREDNEMQRQEMMQKDKTKIDAERQEKKPSQP